MPLRKVGKKQVTHGFGVLENFLAQKRAGKAVELIGEDCQKEKILDVGCGFFPFFLTIIDFKEKYGIDSTIDSKEIAGGGILLKKVDVEKEKIPFPGEFFDVVTILATMEHLDPGRTPFFLKETFRILKKGGKVIITTPSPWSAPILSFFSRIGLLSQEEIDDHKTLHSPEKIVNLLKQLGFASDKIKKGFFEFYLNMWITAQK